MSASPGDSNRPAALSPDSTHFYVTTVGRGQADFRLQGCVSLFDWEKNTVLSRTEGLHPRPWCRQNDNVRGGTRGWRGLIAAPEYVIAANYDTLVWFSRDLKEIYQTVTHPSVSNIHTIHLDGDALLGTSTVNDAIFTYRDNRIEIFPLRERYGMADLLDPWARVLPSQIGVFDRGREYRSAWVNDALHLNSAVRTSSGSLVALLNHLDMLVELEPRPRILWARDAVEQETVRQESSSRAEVDPLNPHDGLSQPHDIVESGGYLYIVSSKNRRLYRWSEEDQLEEVWRENLLVRNRGYLRGLHIMDRYAYIGAGYSSIIKIDLKTGIEIESLTIPPISKRDGSEPDFFPAIFSVVPVTHPLV